MGGGKSAFIPFRNLVQFCKLKTQPRRQVPTPPNVVSELSSSSEMTPHLNLCPRFERERAAEWGT